MHLKIVTYIPDFINKVDMTGLLLLTKEGERVSVLISNDGNRIEDSLSDKDTSRRTIVIAKPVINCESEYDEDAMMDMLEESVVLYADLMYNKDTLFGDEAWIEEISFFNESRCARMERAIPRNFWNPAQRVFKKEQRYEKRDFDRCVRQAFDEYLRLDLEENPGPYDTEDMLRVARGIEHDIWNVYDRMKAQERDKYLAETESAK